MKGTALIGAPIAVLGGAAISVLAFLDGPSGPTSVYGAAAGERVVDLELRDIDGERVRLSELLAGDGATAVVIAMRDIGCPVARRYGHELARIEEEFADRGVRFVFLNANPEDDTDGIRSEELERFGFDGRYVRDPDGRLASRLGVLTTTEVFLIDAAGMLRYRGAIDDQYGITFTKPEPRERYLRNALADVLTGRPVETDATHPEGCYLEVGSTPSTVGGDEAGGDGRRASRVVGVGATDDDAAAELAARAADLPERPLTYHDRISRIVQHNCQTCHREGGIAPFPLETYEQVNAYGAMIRYMVGERLMPPWTASPEHGEWANDRSLSERDRRDLLAWIDEPAPEGDHAHAPVAYDWPEGWNIGEPDAVVRIPEAIGIPADAERHAVSAEYEFAEPGTVLSFLPHMHTRGVAFRYDLVEPDGTERILLDIPRYDFNWQLIYELEEPLRVAAGMRIRATGVYDNSEGNPFNPDPTVDVRFGEQTYEEMMIGYFDWVPDRPRGDGRVAATAGASASPDGR